MGLVSQIEPGRVWSSQARQFGVNGTGLSGRTGLDRIERVCLLGLGWKGRACLMGKERPELERQIGCGLGW
jgi:hypothetical protein